MCLTQAWVWSGQKFLNFDTLPLCLSVLYTERYTVVHITHIHQQEDRRANMFIVLCFFCLWNLSIFKHKKIILGVYCWCQIAARFRQTVPFCIKITFIFIIEDLLCWKTMCKPPSHSADIMILESHKKVRLKGT
jgi:hypothetical protein